MTSQPSMSSIPRQLHRSKQPRSRNKTFFERSSSSSSSSCSAGEDINPENKRINSDMNHTKEQKTISKRELMMKTTAIIMATMTGTDKDRASAFTRPPKGFDLFIDTIDGYEFLRPSNWVEVKGSGNDIFFRNPANVEENLFVAISSPSSDFYKTVKDVGTADEAAKKILKQALGELMSTRIGVLRESEVLEAKEDVDENGRVFYDITVRIASYAAKNQYGLTPEDRPQVLEWDRTFYSRLGTENGRLYELRMQSPTDRYAESSEAYLLGMGKSFRPFEVDTPPPSVGKQLGLNFI